MGKRRMNFDVLRPKNKVTERMKQQYAFIEMEPQLDAELCRL